VAKPDPAALQQAILNYVGGKLTTEGTLHVEVMPFEPTTWPPESSELTGQVVRSVPRMGNGDRLGEATALVRDGLLNGGIDIDGHVVSEASDQAPFNEEHPELGRLLSASVYFTVEPRPDVADSATR
jgi:hypothetical protein